MLAQEGEEERVGDESGQEEEDRTKAGEETSFAWAALSYRYFCTLYSVPGFAGSLSIAVYLLACRKWESVGVEQSHLCRSS